MKRIIGGLFTFLLVAAVPTAKAQVWRPLAEGVSYTPLAMTTERNNLYVLYATGFAEKGRQYGISVWNGSFWRQLPTFNTDSLSSITRLKFFKGHLYIAGKFRSVSGLQNAVNIIRWNGKEYQSITPKIQNPPNQFGLIHDLEIFDNKLFIGGEFSDIQEVKYSNLMAWDGEKFIPPTQLPGLGPNGAILDLRKYNDTLFMCGAFNSITGEPSLSVAGLTATGWKRYKEPGRKFLRFEEFNGKLMVYTQDSLKNRDMVIWQNGRSESASKGIDYLGTVYDMISLNGEIWLCGLFEMADESNVQTIIRYKDNKWNSVTLGNIPVAKLLGILENKLITSGGFITYGKLTLNRIAAYDYVSGYVTGRVFYDKNTNCIFDNRDEIINDRFVLVTPGPYILKPDNLGIFRAFLPPGNYEARVTEKKYWSTSTGCSEVRKFTVSSGTVEDSLDFAQQLKQGVHDVKITLSNSGGWRTAKGNTNLYVLNYENLGSTFITDGVIKMKIAGGLSQIKSFPNYDSIRNNFIYWSYKLLNSGENRKIAVYITIPENFENNTINLAADIQGLQDETEKSDNSDSISQKVNGFQYGAFVKQSFPAPSYPDSVAYLPPGETDLSYTITFANYGTDTVRTVYVIDTLDLNIAMQYTQEIGASHPYTTQVLNGPPGSNLGILIWTFPNINLSPNPRKYTDFVGDKGFISFKVKLKSGLNEGTKIYNKADVVFDLEEFHQTNQVEAKIFKSISIQPALKHGTSAFKVYPNPMLDVLNIQAIDGGIFQWVLRNNLGIIVHQGDSNGKESMQIETNHLSAGIYFLEMIGLKGDTKTNYRVLKSR